MKKLTAVAFVVFAAACSKSDKAATKGGSDCEVAVARGVEQTISKRRGPNAPAMTAAESEVPTKLKAALGKACIDDKWSPEIIECFKTADDMATCKDKLTPEQRGGYTRAAMSVMQGARGSGGMPPHGMGGPGAPGGAPAGGTPPAADGSAAPAQP